MLEIETFDKRKFASREGRFTPAQDALPFNVCHHSINVRLSYRFTNSNSPFVEINAQIKPFRV